MSGSHIRPGVHRIEHGRTNCYLIDTDTGVTLVDAGYPRTWSRIERCLAGIGRSMDDIAAVLITHGHFDHVGVASRLSTTLRTPVWVHRDDLALASFPYSYRPERPRLLYPLAFPRSWPVVAAMLAAGAVGVPGLIADHTFLGGERLPVPGRPLVLDAPGHTDGSSMFVFADHGVILTGDALVTLDPYTGQVGPRLVARAATADRGRASQSLRDLQVPADVDDTAIILPGHGEPWTGGLRASLELAADRSAR